MQTDVHIESRVIFRKINAIHKIAETIDNGISSDKRVVQKSMFIVQLPILLQAGNIIY